MALDLLQWHPAPARGAGIWQASLPAALRRVLADTVPLGAGRMLGEIVELQYSDSASNSSRRRLWRARHPNLDPTFSTIWGAGYLTASGGLGSIPCAFRSPRVQIDTPEGTSVDCTLPTARNYPGEPPRGMSFDLAQLTTSIGSVGPPSSWSTDRAIVHVSTYARPPDQGTAFTDSGHGYVWIQNNLQYTVAGVREVQANSTAEVGFALGGGQVNSYSWVLGAANIQNGSRWYIENAPEFLDAESEFWHDVESGFLFLRPPPGVNDPATLTGLVAVTAQRVLDIGRRTSVGVEPIRHLHFRGLHLSGSRPTFLDEYEAPYRGNSDWTIHRGGAVTFEGVDDVSVSDSHLTALGGNAVFVSNDAKNVAINGNEILDVGDSGVAILGDMLRSTGLGARQYPLNVSVRGNTITEIGRFGKQVTGVFVSTAGFVTVSDNVISSSPSSGIKVNDGFIGGHVFEYNHIFNVLIPANSMLTIW
eukprot:COSAG02_NODE_1327_length_13220_cov_11.602241_7_plen_476_part_00